MKAKASLSRRVFLIVIISFVIVIALARIIFYFAGDDLFYHLKTKDMERRATIVAERINTLTDNQAITNNIYLQAVRVGGVIRVYDLEGELYYSSVPDTSIPTTSLPSDGISHPLINLSVFKQRVKNLPDGTFTYKDETRQIDWINYKLTAQTHIIIISMAIPSINNSVVIFGSALNLTLIIALIAAIFASIFIAHHVSKPLLELNDIATELGDLNFSSHYESNRKDEIGQLGTTLNNLAERLKSTIDRLHQELHKERTTERQRRNFVARASHELQTPLAIINGYTEALQDNIADSEAELQDYYQTIRSETSKLSIMVKDMLELSRLEAPEFDIEMKNLDCSLLICNLVDKLKAGHHLADHFIKDDLCDTSYIINGDHMRLEQAISNILNNALKHTPPEGYIRITAAKMGQEVTFTIFNSGSHILETNLPLIWDSFYTVDVDHGSSKGTGLGLAIAKQIFLRHNFLFGAENYNDGVRFWFTVQLEGE